MRRILLIVFLYVVPLVVHGQHRLTSNGVIIFFSHAAIEDITATNKKVSSGLNVTTSEIAFSVPVKSFDFAKSLMKEHFNEKYMETEKYPTATFSGKVEGYDAQASGIQPVKAKGNLTIHGVTQVVDIPGTLENVKSEIRLRAKFIVRLVDHKVEIPTMFWQNIADQVEVRVDISYPTK